MGILLAIHVLVTIFLILIVLIQKNEGGSSLFANSASGGMFNARGTSNLLTKTTWVLASIFLLNCVLMATLEASKIKNAQTLIEHRESDIDFEPTSDDTLDDASDGEDESDTSGDEASKEPAKNDKVDLGDGSEDEDGE